MKESDESRDKLSGEKESAKLAKASKMMSERRKNSDDHNWGMFMSWCACLFARS
jgi:hypothetical protein